MAAMSWRKWCAALAAVLICGAAEAQTSGGFLSGKPLPSAKLNSTFGSKQDFPIPTPPVGDNSSAAATTAFVRQNNTTINVKLSGVKGDNVTDDYQKIKDADTAVAAAGGGTLYFPAGTYFTSLALQPSSGVNYQGAGKDVTIIRGGGVGLSPFNDSLVIAATFTGGNNQNNLSGTAITYPIDAPTEGINTIKTTTNANAGNFAAGQFILISGDLHSTNFWYPTWFTTVVSANAGTGIITLSENLPFGGAAITTVQRLLAVPHDIKVSDMTILGTNDAAFQITASQNITFDNVAVRAGFGGVSGAGAEFSACRNCSFQNSVSYGPIIDMLGGFDSRIVNSVFNGGSIGFDGGTQNSLISGNTVNNPTDGNGNPTNAISIFTYARRDRVVNNTLVNIPTNFVGINSTGAVGAAAGDGSSVIEGNVITGANATGTIGIAINTSVNNTVVGNWLNNLQFGVLIGTNSTGQMLDANTLVGVTTPYSIDATSSVRQPFVIGPFTIAALPACTVGFTGARATVSNGVASPTYQGAVSATGAATQPVFCNGSGWIYN